MKPSQLITDFVDYRATVSEIDKKQYKTDLGIALKVGAITEAELVNILENETTVKKPKAVKTTRTKKAAMTTTAKKK